MTKMDQNACTDTDAGDSLLEPAHLGSSGPVRLQAQLAADRGAERSSESCSDM